MPNHRSHDNPAAENHLSERLQAFRVERDLTYAKLGVLIGVDAETARRACLGRKLTIRIAAKIERMFAQVKGDARE